MATYLQYMRAAMNHAAYEQMESGEWFASIPVLAGLWVSAPTQEEARQQLGETLDEWLSVHVRIGKNQLPVIDGVNPYELPKRVEHV